MQAVNSILGTTIFGSPGGSHVIVGSDGSITGYYADGRIAYSLVPGANAAITTYADNAGHNNQGYPQVAFAGGLLVFTPDLLNGITPETITFQPSSVALGQAPPLAVNVATTGIAATMNLQLATANTVAWTADSYTTLTPGTGWNNNAIGGVQALQAKVDAEDNTVLNGGVNATSVAPGTIATLDIKHRPSSAYRVGVDVYNSSGVYRARVGCIVNTNGTVGFSLPSGFTFAVGDILGFDLCIPRGNV